MNITYAYAQKRPVQTIKGEVVDEVSKSPIEGATVNLAGNVSTSTITNKDGLFTLLNVPVGRQKIEVSSVGYESQSINDILVTSGKEVLIHISLTEKVSYLDRIVIKAPNRRVVKNEMVAVSGHVFNADDTRKYAGSLGDPSRMVAGFAGVSSSNDSRNDIIVRGNSPNGVLWQIEGIDIPNPNHYGSLSSTGGPVSILNNNNLGKSDFLTGAFPAQYGNALSSVFDLSLRNGNTDRSEFITEVSFTGFEFGAEGPLSKKHQSSFIINYRYSTVGILSNIGLNFGTGKAAPQYQDLTFKAVLPVSQKSKVSIFGLGGPSKIRFLGSDVDSTDENFYSSGNQNLDTKYFMGVLGLTLSTNFNKKTFGKLSVGYSNSWENVQKDSISPISRKLFRSYESNYLTNRFSIAYRLTHKFNSKNNIIVGTDNTLTHFNLFEKNIHGGGAIVKINVNQRKSISLLQAYGQWQHRFNENLSLNTGLHYQTLTLNNSYSLEPRIGLKFVTPNKNNIAFGYGWYSIMQSPLIYFYQTALNNQVYYTNINLGFTKSEQFVASYDYRVSNDIHLKTELYYQLIKSAPVETTPTGFSLLNQGAGFGQDEKDSLVNKGTGRNYGVEFTLEKYFTEGSYFLVTGSLFDSKYKGSDGIERNTAFNTKYAFNILAGKEFKVGKKKNTFTVNARICTVGGKFVSPINIASSEDNNETVYDESSNPYSLKESPYFRSDLKLGYRKNNKRSTLEFGINLNNVTMHKNIFIQQYDKEQHKIVPEYQQGFLPVPYFRFTF